MNFDIPTWLKGLSEDDRQMAALLAANARAEGFAAGVAKADKQAAMNKWLIPVALFGVPVGILIHRYLIG